MVDAQQFKDATGRDPTMDELDRCNCARTGNIGHFWCGWCDDCQVPRFICGHRVPTARRRNTEYTCADCGQRVFAFGNHAGTLCSQCEWNRRMWRLTNSRR